MNKILDAKPDLNSQNYRLSQLGKSNIFAEN